MILRLSITLVLITCVAGDVAPAINSAGTDLFITAGDAGGTVQIAGEDITFITSAGTQQVSVVAIVNQLAQALASVSSLQDTVAALAGEVSALTDAAANSNTVTDTLDAFRVSTAVKLEQLPVLENSININTATARALGASIESIKEVQADSEDGIQFELSALAKEMSVLTNQSNPTCAALGTFDDNLAMHKSVLATDHVVGFVFNMRCADGWYPPAGDVDLTCFPSGNYCPSHKFPFDECAEQVALPTCNACPEGCATCTSASQCTACVEGKELFLSRSGQCVKHLDCKGY
jgi:hypothetical protein